jgi:hypothetical protein
MTMKPRMINENVIFLIMDAVRTVSLHGATSQKTFISILAAVGT